MNTINSWRPGEGDCNYFVLDGEIHITDIFENGKWVKVDNSWRPDDWVNPHKQEADEYEYYEEPYEAEAFEAGADAMLEVLKALHGKCYTDIEVEHYRDYGWVIFIKEYI